MDNKKYKPVTHVIFDLDGLLLDTEVVYKAVIESIAKENGKVYTEDVRMKVIGTPENIGSQIVVSNLKLPMDPEQFAEEFRNRSKPLLSSSPLMPGAERLVQHLHNNKIPIAIATSSDQESLNIKSLNHRHIFSLFHHIVAGGSDPEVRRGKPNPDIYLVCASRFPANPKPEECLVFEDAPNGVMAATDAGMQCVMVPDPITPAELRQRATLVLKSLEDVVPEWFGLPSFDKKTST